jgi:hypothetical protein
MTMNRNVSPFMDEIFRCVTSGFAVTYGGVKVFGRCGRNLSPHDLYTADTLRTADEHLSYAGQLS